MAKISVSFDKTFVILLLLVSQAAFAADVRLKDLARVEQTRSQALVGYGLVTGLAGTGDSARSKVTIQSLRNTLSRFGIEVSEDDISSRNVAAVVVSAELSSYSEVGGKFDVAVSSIGDAKSLSGGVLMLAPLKSVDDKIYGFAKGALATGGYNVDSFSSSFRKNHSTAGQIVRGGTLERPLEIGMIKGETINIYLHEPDYTTAVRMVEAIRQSTGENVRADHAGKVVADLPKGVSPVEFIAALEKLRITPDIESRVVINEKTGTIVSGGGVLIGAVTISHGNLKIEIDTTFTASQPSNVVSSGSGITSIVVPNTTISVKEGGPRPVTLRDGTTVADLVVTLSEVGLSTRDAITILQGIKSAGALHAELVIQ